MSDRANDTWTPPNPRGKRNAHLKTLRAWRWQRLRRRSGVTFFGVVLLVGTITAWSIEAHIGPVRADALRADVLD